MFDTSFIIFPSLLSLFLVHLALSFDQRLKDVLVSRMFPVLLVIQAAWTFLLYRENLETPFFELKDINLSLVLLAVFFSSLSSMNSNLRGEQLGQESLASEIARLLLLILFAVLKEPVLVGLCFFLYPLIETDFIRSSKKMNFGAYVCLIALFLFSLPYLIQVGTSAEIGFASASSSLSFLLFAMAPLLFVFWSLRKKQLSLGSFLSEMTYALLIFCICLLRFVFPYFEKSTASSELFFMYWLSGFVLLFGLFFYQMAKTKHVGVMVGCLFALFGLSYMINYSLWPKDMHFLALSLFSVVAASAWVEFALGNSNLSTKATASQLSIGLTKGEHWGQSYIFSFGLLGFLAIMVLPAVESVLVQIPSSILQKHNELEWIGLILGFCYAALQMGVSLLFFKDYFFAPQGERIVLPKYYANVEVILLNTLIILGFFSSPLYKYIAL